MSIIFHSDGMFQPEVVAVRIESMLLLCYVLTCTYCYVHVMAYLAELWP